MYFNRMAEYFSGSRPAATRSKATRSSWVKVPFNEARYGRDFCGGIVCNNTWFLIRDAMAFWVQSQLAAGKTLAAVADYLKTFDVWDRYDIDGDGNFDEPDGFIDHFQIVHAGGDEAAGDPQQGTDAIWSHRWYADGSGGGPGGFRASRRRLRPAGRRQRGVRVRRIGSIPNNPTGIWVGDYTIQPENGGLGVFAHEYAHDLGLPDLYDTSGNTGGAENSTGFWTLMCSGANIGDGGRDGIGDAPTDLGAWEKLQLGWLGCERAQAGSSTTSSSRRAEHKLRLGPNDAATKHGLQARVRDPARQAARHGRRRLRRPAPTSTGAPWATTSTTSMTKAVTLPRAPTLTAEVRYEIEEHFDYAFVEASTNGGTTLDAGADEPVATRFR